MSGGIHLPPPSPVPSASATSTSVTAWWQPASGATDADAITAMQLAASAPPPSLGRWLFREAGEDGERWRTRKRVCRVKRSCVAEDPEGLGTGAAGRLQLRRRLRLRQRRTWCWRRRQPFRERTEQQVLLRASVGAGRWLMRAMPTELDTFGAWSWGS